MKRLSATASALLLACTSLAPGAVPGPTAITAAPPAVLRWQNGETIEGELLEATADHLSWKSHLFEDPLVLKWSAVRRIDRHIEPVAPVDPFSIALRDGSHIYGAIVSFNENAVTIRSARHGEAVLKRSEVLSARRVRSDGALIYSGPSGDVGWEPAGSGKRVNSRAKSTDPATALSSVTTGPGGALLMPFWNRGAFRELTLPERVDVELRIHSSKRLEFEFAFGVGTKRLRLETWDNELVFAVLDQFQRIRTLADDECAMTVRLCWDSAARRCALYNSAGELLGEWKTPENTDPAASVLIQGKGRDLSVDRLRIRTWDGQPPARIGTQPRLELTDGRALEGQITTTNGQAVSLRAGDHATLREFPLGEVEALVFSPDTPVAKTAPFDFEFADATMLSGELVGIENGRARVKVSFTDEPLSVALEGLRQFSRNARADDREDPGETLATGKLDELVLQQGTLHGTVVGTGEDSPRWLPVGGVRPSMPSRIFTNEIRRALPAALEFPAPPALFYTSTGDVLPGDLRAIDASGVELTSTITDTTKLNIAELDAIQFGAVAQLHMRGFNDAGWRMVKGDAQTIRKSETGIEIDPGSAIGHPGAMQSSEIRFNLLPIALATVRLRLFCAGTEPGRSMNLIIAPFGNRVYYGLESSEGQLQNQFQSNLSTGEPLAVTLSIAERHIELQLNGGVVSQRFVIDQTKRAGSGLVIEPASIWGNTSRPISLTEFATRSLPGRTWLPEVNSEAKVQALTIPRFRKDAPPRHALLAANGDVLRGEIEAATATHFAFRSGLEMLRIPRDRVKAVIWLKKPGAGEAPSIEQRPSLRGLDQLIERYTRFSGVGLNSLISFLQQQAPELKFKLPSKPDDRRIAMQFGGQTISAALEQICSQFGLRHRTDADGTILLEPAAQSSNDLFQRVFWLKTDPFAQRAAAEKVLSEKGIAFPKGASVTWDGRARQLVVTNTLANHEALAQLLAKEFGGIAGSPTHWLLLTSGARLGLAVDKFDHDVIRGRHPLYGECRVPMADVFVVRTSVPEPTAAMRSLADWQLVFAPEPVLPESGGESSPLLGKPAPPFKLTLLDGGEFDLVKEKGKVVVLDFWATWCGPCIKSLPEVIAATAQFPADRVQLIGVNQSEPPQQVQRFLETHHWKMTVALDATQSVARQYGVDGIPHTVVVGPDGKVAWVKSGYTPEGGKELADAIKQLFAQAETTPAPAAAPNPSSPAPESGAARTP
jgi:peroxiredoxin